MTERPPQSLTVLPADAGCKASSIITSATASRPAAAVSITEVGRLRRAARAEQRPHSLQTSPHSRQHRLVTLSRTCSRSVAVQLPPAHHGAALVPELRFQPAACRALHRHWHAGSLEGRSGARSLRGGPSTSGPHERGHDARAPSAWPAAAAGRRPTEGASGPSCSLSLPGECKSA